MLGPEGGEGTRARPEVGRGSGRRCLRAERGRGPGRRCPRAERGRGPGPRCLRAERADGPRGLRSRAVGGARGAQASLASWPRGCGGLPTAVGRAEALSEVAPPRVVSSRFRSRPRRRAAGSAPSGSAERPEPRAAVFPCCFCGWSRPGFQRRRPSRGPCFHCAPCWALCARGRRGRASVDAGWVRQRVVAGVAGGLAPGKMDACRGPLRSLLLSALHSVLGRRTRASRRPLPERVRASARFVLPAPRVVEATSSLEAASRDRVEGPDFCVHVCDPKSVFSGPPRRSS